MDKGTGAVMCATYGDTADTAWCEKHGLPYKRVICPDGTIDREVPLIGGMKIRQAREALTAETGNRRSPGTQGRDDPYGSRT